jgi:glutathione peroxidase-family protein
MSGFHDLTMNDIEGRPVAFSTFAGKHCLIVNVASR